jgi:hypothetical protein
MVRSVQVVLAALAGLSLTASAACAFTIVNQSNYAEGGARIMMTNPDAAYGQAKQAPSLGISHGDLPGYGGYGVFDRSQGSTAHDNFPSFPGQDNHLTPGTNAGVLQYGAVPGRNYGW